MVGLQYRAWLDQPDSEFFTGISALYIEATDQGIHLVSGTAGDGGGLTSFTLSQGQTLTQTDQSYYSAAQASVAEGPLAMVSVSGGQQVLLVGGAEGASMTGTVLGASGDLGATVSPSGLEGFDDGALTVAANGAVFMCAAGTGELLCYEQNGAGGFALEASLAGQTEAPVALDTIEVGGNMFLLALCGSSATVSAYELDAADGMIARGTMGASKGLGILDQPVGMGAATIAGQSYVIVASASSSGASGALSVMQVSETGSLLPTDHLLDTLDTRFGRAQSLTVTEADGAVYVTVGGGDDGLSLFTLLPGGRLLHLDTVSDGLNVGLDNVSALAAVQAGDELQIFASSQSEAGLTQMSVSLAGQGSVMTATAGAADTLTGSAAGDILSGGAAGDLLQGGDGDDVLDGGAGADSLTGGAGADIFYLRFDGDRDVITDFDPDADQLDLSDFWMLYDPWQLEVSSQSWGALLTWRGEVTEIRSADGQSLSYYEVVSAVRDGADRPPLLVRNELIGGDSGDVLTGTNSDDDIYGLDGEDEITGGDGNDQIYGGNGADDIHSGPGDDTVTGGNGLDKIILGVGDDFFYDQAQDDEYGGDTVAGNAGNDTLHGWGGADVLHGQAGFDSVAGGIGNDTITGGAGYDTLRGGEGNDLVVGGDGRDLAWLGGGDDLFADNTQSGPKGNDTVYANAGNDTLGGGAGDDVFHGQDGQDRLLGRLENDKLFGGNQDDYLDGGPGNDTLAGGNGRDTAWMGDGADVWWDNSQQTYGDDWVHAGAGNDTLNIGGGADTLTGGAGADTFIFTGDIGHDVITDYALGTDNLQLDQDLWGAFFTIYRLQAIASVQEGNLVLDLIGDNSLTLNGITSIDGLLDDITMI